MKLRDTRNVESTFGDQFETTGFTAEVGGKFFDIMLDKLYTNKPRTIIRELSTNAYDSHVVAGKADVPFFVQLPTELDSNFTVRDYGVSLSHDDVMHLYTSVFTSTKTNSDDLVGAWGLGSKTPFAYTDSFVVTAWLDGEKRVYLATRGGDGTPSLSHLTTEPSDEPQGFSVSFPVKQEDHWRFRNEAATVFEGFDVLPDIPGLELKIQEPLFFGENWTVTEGYQPHAIRQGCVIYPVHELNVETGLVHGYTLTVTVPIGTAQVTANREALSMDDVTTTNVTDVIESAAKELRQQIYGFISDAPDLFEANVRFNHLDGFFVFEPESVLYHGQIVNGVIRFDHVGPEHILDYRQKDRQSKFKVHINNAPELVFLVDRTGNNVPRKTTRIRSYVKGIRRAEGKIFILKDPTSGQLGALVRRLHLTADQIVGVASLPDVKIVRAPRASVKGPVQGVYDLRNRCLAVDQLEADYVWVEVERIDGRDWTKSLGIFESTAGYYDKESGAVKRTLNDAYDTIGETRPFYAMTPGAIKKYKPSPANNIHKIVPTWVADNKRIVARQVKIAAAVQHLKSASRTVNYRNLLTDEHIDKLLARLAPNATSFGYDYGTAQLLSRLNPSAREAAEAQGEAFAEKVEERYPLLFSPAGDDILRYIQSNPRKRKGA